MIGELYPGEFEAMEHNGRMDALEQEPCDVFDEYGNYKYPGDVELTEPNTATSMPCEDAISRQAVIEQINYWAIGTREYLYTNATDYLIRRIQDIPPVNPQPKTGHWINHYDEDAKEGWYECDRCHTERAFNTDFCPDCGARMVEPQETETWNGIHAQLTAPKGTFERIFNDADDDNEI